MNSKKSNIFRILLSVVALLVILSVGVGVAFAWIEGGDRYSLYTENINLEGPALPSTANNKFTTGTITLNPKKTTLINLDDIYDNITVADSIMFTPMSSDGTNFYLPQAYDESGTPTYFREATTNDRGTKYIDFDFKVKTTTQCYIAFGADPVITVKKGGSTLSVDTSALRFMITDGTTTKILSTSKKEFTNSKVTSDGIISDDSLTIEPFESYKNETGKLRLFSFNKKIDEPVTLRLAIWLDCFNPVTEDNGNVSDSLSALAGSEIEISLNLVVDQEKVNIKFTPITQDCNEKVKDDPDEGGKIAKQSDDLVIGDKFVLPTATANDNFDFIGWYSSNTDFSDTNEVTAETIVDGQITEIFAVFRERPKYTITVGSLTVPSTETGGTVTIDDKANSTTDYKDKTVTLKATPAEGYRFAGWYSDETCNTSATGLVSKNADGSTSEFTIKEANQSFYAKFIKTYTVTLTPICDGAVNSECASSLKIELTGSTQSVTGSSQKIELTVDYNSTVKVSASENEGYLFDGIYTSISGTSNVSTITVNSDTDLFARFTARPKYTIDVGTSGGGTVTVGGSSTSYTGYAGDKVTIVATPSANYEFAGWFTNSACTGTAIFDSSNATKEITISESITYYAKFNSTSTGYEIRYTDNWDDGLDMLYTDSSKTTVSVTHTFSSGTISFKVYDGNDGNDGKWYGSNSTVYNETSSNLTLTTDTNDIKFHMLGGTYTFKYTIGTKSLQIIDDKSGTVFVFDASSFTDVQNADAIIYLQDVNNGNTGYRMTKVDTAVWMAHVSSPGTKITFKRNNPGNTTTWNEWTETTRTTSQRRYKVSGWGTGSWQNN